MKKQSPTSIPLLIILTLSIFSYTHASISRTISRAELGLNDSNTQTHITFYYHETQSGSNPTLVQIAKSTNTDKSATSFGSLSMFDDPLTESSDRTSKSVGRAQGVQASADLNALALTMIMNMVFTEGDYNGSTLSVLGRNQVSEGVRELPVVGGTGVFRFAQGYAQAKTFSLDKKSGDSVVQYDVYVSHAESSDGGGGGSTVVPSSSGAKSGGGAASNHAPACTGSVLVVFIMSLLILPLFFFA